MSPQPPTKATTRVRIETAHRLLGELMKGNLGTEPNERFMQLGLTRALLASMLAELLMTIPGRDQHRPVEYAEMTLGCSCGYCPQQAWRVSTIPDAYHAHLSSLGIRPYDHYTGGDVLIQFGEHAGKTWRQAHPEYGFR